MDIVRKRIEEINGTIAVDTEPGKRTSFHITLPLTVVSQNSLIFDIHGVTFAFPLQNIADTTKVRRVIANGRIFTIEDLLSGKAKNAAH